MNRERFFKDQRLPFVEGRYSQDSRRVFKPHIHRSFCIGAVDQGDVFYQAEGQSVHLKPGALTRINPEALHSCNPQTSDARSYSMLYLQTDWVFIPDGMLHDGVVIGGRLPKGVEMKPCRKTGFLRLILLSLLICHQGVAADESGRLQPVQIEKTFDQGTLITHTLKLVQPPHIVSLHVSQRRAAEGSDDIQQSYLRFRYETPEEAPPMTRTEFDALFGELMRALRDAFGPHLDLESLGSDGFLGVKEMEKSSALAFRNFAPWAAYLENPTAFTQWQNHEMVLARWKAAKVFEPVVAALGRAGYDAELSGFEKLFVFKADESKIRPELEALGIPGSQQFPYPGTIAFTINARR